MWPVNSALACDHQSTVPGFVEVVQVILDHQYIIKPDETQYRKSVRIVLSHACILYLHRSQQDAGPFSVATMEFQGLKQMIRNFSSLFRSLLLEALVDSRRLFTCALLVKQPYLSRGVKFGNTLELP